MVFFWIVFIFAEIILQSELALQADVVDITVICNKHFYAQIQNTFPPNNSKYINLTFYNTDIVEIDDDICNLQTISKIDISKSDIIFLFTNHDNLFENYLRTSTDQIIWKYGTSLSEMVSNEFKCFQIVLLILFVFVLLKDS